MMPPDKDKLYGGRSVWLPSFVSRDDENLASISPNRALESASNVFVHSGFQVLSFYATETCNSKENEAAASAMATHIRDKVEVHPACLVCAGRIHLGVPPPVYRVRSRPGHGYL